MPNLNDYIGGLVSSITNARVMSDIQTVKVAEQYAKHELLKHFSVPRMRIDDVEMTVPVALNGFVEKTETYYELINKERLSTTLFKQLSSGLKVIQTDDKKLLQFKNIISKQIDSIDELLRVDDSSVVTKSVSLNILSEILAIDISKLKKNTLTKFELAALNSKIETAINKEIKIINRKSVIENLEVIAEASKLREQKPENIIYIKLKITEDGMEWNTSEDLEGKTNARLIPE